MQFFLQEEYVRLDDLIEWPNLIVLQFYLNTSI